MGVILADSADAVNSVASGKPVIGGVVAVGESLFADVSGVRDLDGVSSSFVYQWVRVDGGVEEDISGATLAIYNVVSADEGKLLKVKVSFIDGVGYSEGPLASDSTGAVLDAAPIVSHGTKLFGTISLSGFNSQSIWSDGITLYVLNSNLVDSRIYAYRMSDKRRDSSKDFNTLGPAGNDRPQGIWSDGVTMWVTDSVDDKIYAYRMSDKSHDSDKDFNTLDPAGNDDPNGMWSDGVTMWVADFTDGKIYAYRMSNKRHDSGKDFNTLVAAGNGVPIGIWSDGVTMWVGDYDDAYVYAYRMSDKSRDSGKDLDVASDLSTFLTGIGFDGQAMLIGSWNEVHFYAIDSPVYKLPRWSEDSGKDCGVDMSTGCSVDVNGYGVGIVDPAAEFDWWSLELEGGKTYAIDVKGAGDQSDNDNAGTLPDPFVILYSHFGENPLLEDFSDNVDDGQNKNSRVVYSVGLDAGGTYYVSVAKPLNSPESGGTYTLLVKDLNSVPVFESGSIFSVDENVLSVGTVVASDPNIQDNVTGYSVSGGVDGARFSITDAGVLSFKSAPNYESPVDSGGNNVYTLVVTATSGTGSRVRTATQSIVVTVNDVNEPNSPATGKPVISGVVAVGESLFADAYVSDVRDLNGLPDSFVYQWVRVDNGSEEDISGATRAIYNVVLADEGKKLKVKVSFIDGDGYSENSLASDSTGAVLDAAPIVPHGTKLSGRLAITYPFRPGGFGLRNVWSDGITLYGLSFHSTDAHIYAYRMSDGSRDRSKEFSNVGRKFREAIWSDGVTMWVADTTGFSAEAKLYAYRMSDKRRDSGKDFNTLNAARNGAPDGIWSDGVTMWVADSVDNKIYAYRMSDKRRDSGKDFNTLNATGNNDPRGIWSDGVTMWVGDYADVYVYAYRMSDKSRDSGKDLDVDSDLPIFGLTGIGSDGRTMLISSFSRIHFYAIDSPVYKLPRWSEDLGKDCGGDGVSTGCSVDVNGYGVGIVDPAADIDWWSLELEGGKTYTIDVKGAGDQSGNDNAGTLPDPFVSLFSHLGESPLLANINDNVNDGQNKNSRVVYSVSLDAGGTYYVSVAKAISSSEEGTYTLLVKNSNSVPVFSSGSIFSVDENVRSVGAVVASDSDALDDVAGYSVSGGVDSARFSITDAGVLSFVSAPDFENPVDSGGNNVYDLVVAASGGSGGRVRIATQSVMVTVFDVDEAPLRPDVPVLSSPSPTGLLVMWSVPDNAGPVISDYDVQYKANSSDSFLNWTHDGVATNTTITGLNENTAYDVQVRATSDEGTSGWSPVASGTTGVTPNNLPEFSSGTTFSVQENVAEVSTVVASDSDQQDDVTGYRVSGGVDSALFEIDNGGVLTFKSVPDFERPSDTGANNGYVVVVEATSGTGGRVNTATQTITVTVTDVDEVPSTPSAPVLSSPSSNSLSVSWSAPGNTGPSIIDYDVGYGLNSGGPFTDWPHSGAGRSAVITGLNASTLYYVRVLARNAEGDSSWSETASFTTGSAVVNSDPIFSSSSSFSVSENVRRVGVVVASDSDGEDSVVGYRVSGGVDSARFSITTGGVLTFRSAPDYEVPVDVGGNNVYDLVVTVTSGTGSRVRTATQSVTVTVVDVVEGRRNSLPVFSSSSSFSVNENVRSVGTVVASDPDNQDDVAGYRVSGGADRARFSITTGGVLTFRSAPDYEVPVDVGGNNVYDLVVTVTSGTGSRVRTDSQSISVTVVDLDEAPSAPSAPTLSSPSSTSLLVSWSAPGGTGPSIIDYDLGYGLNSNGPFTDWPHSDASRSATITGLNASTLYYVRVLARNAEGDSGWSETDSFTTGSAVTNSDPVFTSSSSFSVSENVRRVGVVVASDVDGEDSVVGYRVSGGVDSARFSITGGGVLTFRSAPDFEVPVDVGGNNVYDLVVTVTSGTGSRVRTATQSVTVTVVDVVEGRRNSLLVFSSSSSFSVNENVRSVGTVVASDPDNQDDVAGYRVSGGADRARFSITGGGVLTFRSAPDFEVPVDVGGNNVYNLVVTVTSGTGSRVRTATQTIKITVTDVDEVPSTPSAPVLGSPSSTSLSVSWSAPGNTGPSIIDYDVGYGRNSNGPFTDWPHSDASRSAVITGLNASTLYYVRVLARNAEGDSSWSEPASFTTGSAVTNSDPVFTSSSSFSVNENVRNVGTVVASDGDSPDSVTGYRVSGGVDSARFSITNGGVLSFVSAPDYEVPVDSGGNNVYDLVVTVTSGTGSRVRTATQSISVTVNDVGEGPVIPPKEVVLVYNCG